MLFVAPHTKESVVACNVRFASLLVHGLVLNLVMNPCRPEHATIQSVLNILVLHVRTPLWWTSSRACVKQSKVSFRSLSNCAKVGKNSVSRLSPPCIFSKNCAFSPGTQDRRNALQLLHLPSVELVRDTYGPSTVFGVGLGCKIERRQMLHTEARPGWHTCASDPLLVLEPHNELQLSERWNRSDPALDMPCELHEQKPESKD